jgi:hypothetical protein
MIDVHLLLPGVAFRSVPTEKESLFYLHQILSSLDDQRAPTCYLKKNWSYLNRLNATGDQSDYFDGSVSWLESTQGSKNNRSPVDANCSGLI